MFATFAISASYGVLFPLFPASMGEIMPGSDAVIRSRHVGILAGLYPVAMVLGAPLWGRLADRKGPRLVIIIGLFGLALSLALLKGMMLPAPRFRWIALRRTLIVGLPG